MYNTKTWEQAHLNRTQSLLMILITSVFFLFYHFKMSLFYPLVFYDPYAFLYMKNVVTLLIKVLYKIYFYCTYLY